MARPKKLKTHIEAFLRDSETRCKRSSLVSRRSILTRFLRFAEARKWGATRDITTRRVLAYVAHRRKLGRQLRTVEGEVSTIRVFFRWLVRKRELEESPVPDLLTKRAPRRLPSAFLTAEELDQILDGIVVDRPTRLRDRAMLEVMYSSGLRRSELVVLTPRDIDRGRGLLYVAENKSRARLVPCGERALDWLDRYLREARPKLVKKRDPGGLFLNKYGENLGSSAVRIQCVAHAKRAGIGKASHPHAWRHAAATLMLENGADIRYVQAFLGHQNIDTTVVYTRVSIRTLKRVHSQTHPFEMRS